MITAGTEKRNALIPALKESNQLLKHHEIYYDENEKWKGIRSKWKGHLQVHHNFDEVCITQCASQHNPEYEIDALRTDSRQ